METIVRENRPVELEGVVKSRVDDSKWEGLESLDVGSKFLMFEKGGSQDRETRVASDRWDQDMEDSFQTLVTKYF